MTMVSKNLMSPSISERIRELLNETIALIRSKKDVGNFFDEFFTRTEKIMFAKRLAIAVLLAKGYDFISVSKTLKVSTATVLKVNVWINHSNGAFKKVIEKIIEKENSDDFMHSLWYFIESATVTLQRGDWKNRRRQIEQSHRDFLNKHVI